MNQTESTSSNVRSLNVTTDQLLILTFTLDRSICEDQKKLKEAQECCDNRKANPEFFEGSILTMDELLEYTKELEAKVSSSTELLATLRKAYWY